MIKRNFDQIKVPFFVTLKKNNDRNFKRICIEANRFA